MGVSSKFPRRESSLLKVTLQEKAPEDGALGSDLTPKNSEACTPGRDRGFKIGKFGPPESTKEGEYGNHT